MDSLTFYVDEDDAQQVEALLHDRIVDDETLSSVTVEDDIAVIRVTAGDPSKPNLALRVIEPVADAHVHIYDVLTSATSVSVFVPWDDREQALSLIQDEF
jgi:aspartate kinase